MWLSQGSGVLNFGLFVPKQLALLRPIILNAIGVFFPLYSKENLQKINEK